MADIDWKSRIADRRDAAQAGIDALSDNAREAVATARNRIGSTYGAARQRADGLADSGRELARTGIATGTRLAAQGKDVAEKAAFNARGLIAERPLTAIAVGVAAGAVLGLLANRLASGPAGPDPVEDDEIYD
jgi:ElaB/YqjD/DUF883 family membrane-anchored ribosome-binding protein